MEIIAIGIAPSGRRRESFTTNVRGAQGGFVMDEQGNVQEGSAWGTVLDLLPCGSTADPGEALLLHADQDWERERAMVARATVHTEYEWR